MLHELLLEFHHLWVQGNINYLIIFCNYLEKGFVGDGYGGTWIEIRRNDALLAQSVAKTFSSEISGYHLHLENQNSSLYSV